MLKKCTSIHAFLHNIQYIFELNTTLHKAAHAQSNLVPRIFLLPSAIEREEEVPCERGWRPRLVGSGDERTNTASPTRPGHALIHALLIYDLHTFCCGVAQTLDIVHSCHFICSLPSNFFVSRYGVLGGGCDIFVLQ